MLFPNVTTEKVMELAAQVGRRVASDYPGVDAEDIASEAFVRLLEKAPKMDDPAAGYVYRVLERDGGAYAAKVRYDYVVSTSQYVYTPNEVKAILTEVYFDPAAWDVPHAKDDRLSAEINGRSLGVSLMDMREAMKRIKPEYRKVLEDKFFREEEVHHQKVSRAVDAITRSLNRIAVKTGKGDNCPGARTVMSNSTAQYVTRVEAGHETNLHGRDAVNELQSVRKNAGSAPPGTYYNWDKYRTI